MPKIFDTLKKLEPIYKVIYKIFLTLCKLFLIADILVTSWVVLARHVPAIPAPNWGEEIILTLMAYMAVLSASLAIRRNAHIRMTTFDRYLPKKVIPYLDLFSDLCVLALAIVMIAAGLPYAMRLPGTYISMTWLPKFWQYFPVPLAGIAMVFFEIERIYIDFCHMYGDFSDVDRIAEETRIRVDDFATGKEAK